MSNYKKLNDYKRLYTLWNIKWAVNGLDYKILSSEPMLEGFIQTLIGMHSIAVPKNN